MFKRKQPPVEIPRRKSTAEVDVAPVYTTEPIIELTFRQWDNILLATVYRLTLGLTLDRAKAFRDDLDAAIKRAERG